MYKCAWDANIIPWMGKTLRGVKMTQKSFPPLEKGIGLGLTELNCIIVHMCKSALDLYLFLRGGMIFESF